VAHETGHCIEERDVPVSKVATFVDDAFLLLLLTISIPFAFLIVGTPLALVIRLVLEILRKVF
jgi:hypothetical protein